MLTAEKIAQICHEANRAYCFTLGDFSQPTWDMAPKWQKESVIAGVKSALADSSKSAEQSHFEWMEFKRKAGWKHGPNKRPEALEHPCMRPWVELPPEQQVKDELFLAVVRAVSGGKLAERSEEPSKARPGDSTMEVGIITNDGKIIKGGQIEGDKVVGGTERPLQDSDIKDAAETAKQRGRKHPKKQEPVSSGE